MFIIQDGTDGSKTLKVDKNNRAHAFSVSASLQAQSALNGNSYNVNTGTMVLTSDTESGVAYIKNNGDTALHIEQIGYLIGASTGGAGQEINVTIKRNPMAGTVISDAIVTDININKNFSSTRSLNAVAYKGGEGKTLIDGVDAYYSLIASDSSSTPINTGTIVLERGASLGICVTPGAGNTAVNMQVFFAIIDYNF